MSIEHLDFPTPEWATPRAQSRYIAPSHVEVQRNWNQERKSDFWRKARIVLFSWLACVAVFVIFFGIIL